MPEFSSKLRSFRFFATTPVEPIHSVFQVLRDPEHPQHDNLLADLSTYVSQDMLEDYQQNLEYLEADYETDLCKKARIFVHVLHKEIERARITELLSRAVRPTPYQSPNLMNIPINKDNLISTKCFDFSNGYFRYKNYIYFLCPTVGFLHSNYWLSQIIIKNVKQRNCQFQVRLNPFLEILKSDFTPLQFGTKVYPKKPDWNSMFSLTEDCTMKSQDIEGHSSYRITEGVWKPIENELHAIFEEIPSDEHQKLLVGRYFHAIFNKESTGITYCNGSLRVYTKAELAMRKRVHVKNIAARNMGKRIKIFQYDSDDMGNSELDKEDFISFIGNFFVWNWDIHTYFCD